VEVYWFVDNGIKQKGELGAVPISRKLISYLNARFGGSVIGNDFRSVGSRMDGMETEY
jgi:hypothetical protein